MFGDGVGMKRPGLGRIFPVREGQQELLEFFDKHGGYIFQRNILQSSGIEEHLEFMAGVSIFSPASPAGILLLPLHQILHEGDQGVLVFFLVEPDSHLFNAWQAIFVCQFSGNGFCLFLEIGQDRIPHDVVRFGFPDCFGGFVPVFLTGQFDRSLYSLVSSVLCDSQENDIFPLLVGPVVELKMECHTASND